MNRPPLGELASSFERVARDPRFVLSYGDSEGYEPLRSAIAARMNARGASAISARNVIVLTGSTQGIMIVAQSLAEPGDEIIVESPSYPGALQIFQINGLRAIPVPVDDEGMRVDHVEAILRTRRPRFIYTMPSLHNPTNATMNADRRERLATIARRAGVPIIEDDPYGPLSRQDVPPLVALAPDHVVYLSTFSKTVAPSLRVGWLAAPRMILERLLLRKQAYDMATSLYVQAAIVDYLERGYDAHVTQLREELLLRRKLADEAIAAHWPQGVRAAGAAGRILPVGANAARIARESAARRRRAARCIVSFRRSILCRFRRRPSFPFGAHGGDARADRRGHSPDRAGDRDAARMTASATRCCCAGTSGTDAARCRGAVVRDPYYTLVSEFMLQQTQVDRVVPKFESFVARFPSLAALAEASQAEVLRLWQGLGYNSRAIRLHGVARAVIGEHGGVMPSERDALLVCPESVRIPQPPFVRSHSISTMRRSIRIYGVSCIASRSASSSRHVPLLRSSTRPRARSRRRERRTIGIRR